MAWSKEDSPPEFKYLFDDDRPDFDDLAITRLPRDDLRVLAWKAINKDKYREVLRAFKRDLVWHGLNRDQHWGYYFWADDFAEKVFPQYGWVQIWDVVASDPDFIRFNH